MVCGLSVCAGVQLTTTLAALPTEVCAGAQTICGVTLTRPAFASRFAVTSPGTQTARPWGLQPGRTPDMSARVFRPGTVQVSPGERWPPNWPLPGHHAVQCADMARLPRDEHHTGRHPDRLADRDRGRRPAWTLTGSSGSHMRRWVIGRVEVTGPGWRLKGSQPPVVHRSAHLSRERPSACGLSIRANATPHNSRSGESITLPGVQSGGQTPRHRLLRCTMST